LLTDAQKDKVANVFGWWDWRLLVALTLLTAPGLILFWIFREPLISLQPMAVLGFLLYTLCAQYVLTFYQWLVLRGLLSGAQWTADRIAFGERFSAYSMMIPRGFLIFNAVFFAALLIFFGYGAFVLKIWDLSLLASMTLAGAGIAATLFLLSAQRRAKQN
jgi:hypothetical protein